METATARMIEKNVFMVLKYRCRHLVCVYRFSLRCASATKIVRPQETTIEMQPQLQPAVLRLSAINFQYFTWGVVSRCGEIRQVYPPDEIISRSQDAFGAVSEWAAENGGS